MEIACRIGLLRGCHDMFYFLIERVVFTRKNAVKMKRLEAGKIVK